MDSGCASPAAYKASISDPDTMTYKQAMQDTNHIQEWRKAMDIEISQLEAINSWDEVNISDVKSKIIPGTWVFCIKQMPDGEIKKCKARFCCRGDLQEDSFETFTPVVSWTSVHPFLVLTTILHWSDFTNMFIRRLCLRQESGSTSPEDTTPYALDGLAFS